MARWPFRKRIFRKSSNLFFDTRKSVDFRRDSQNILYQVTSTQLPAMQDLALGDLFLTKGHIREPHWHPNANELDYVVSGEVIISVLDPLTPQLLTYRVGPGQLVFIPINWWHWITAVSDKAHVVEMFSNDQRQIAEGSDMLRLTPKKVFQLAYRVDAKELAKVLRPIKNTVVIGPPNSIRSAALNKIVRTLPAATSSRTGGHATGSSPNLFYDAKNNSSFERNAQNILYEVTATQLPVLEGLALGDLFLSKEHIREPHWHPKANELDYVVSGEVIVSILDPFSLRRHSYHVKPRQVVFIPKGWWHWITAVTDNVHVLVIFSDNKIESIQGSDVLRLTSSDAFQLAYNVNAQELAKVLAPIDETVVIGPPDK